MRNFPISAKHMALAEEFVGGGNLNTTRATMLANFIAGYPDGTPNRINQAVQDHLKWDEQDAALIEPDFTAIMQHTAARNNMDGSASMEGVEFEGNVQARVHLDWPVTIDGTAVEWVTVNRPTGRTLQLWSESRAEHLAMIAADLIGWPLSVTMDFAFADLLVIFGVYTRFRSSPPVEPGASGEQTDSASTESTNGSETPPTEENSIE